MDALYVLKEKAFLNGIGFLPFLWEKRPILGKGISRHSTELSFTSRGYFFGLSLRNFRYTIPRKRQLLSTEFANSSANSRKLISDKIFAPGCPAGTSKDGGWWRVLTAVAGPVLVFSVAFNLPTFFHFVVVEDDLGYIYFNATRLRVHESYVFWYLNLARGLVTGVAPLFLLCALNYLIFRHLVARRRDVHMLFERRPGEKE